MSEDNTIPFNPINEDDLEDKRNLITEGTFVEIDIALKAYDVCFGQDRAYDDLSLLQTTLAYLISNHPNDHTLGNVKIDEYVIPKSPFKTADGEPTDKLYNLTEFDKIHYITNIIINAKKGFNELIQSGYFNNTNPDLLLDLQVLIYHLNLQFDTCILLMNNTYSKVILNL